MSKDRKNLNLDAVVMIFWWCLQNVAKGIARDQFTYARIHELPKSIEKFVEIDDKSYMEFFRK